MKTILLFSAVICGLALGQGSMTPPGGPSPTMKSLQEIWDKSVALEARNQTQQQQIATLLQKNNEQNAALGILLEKNGVTLPWNVSVRVPVGTSGGDSSLAFQPNGLPSISYFDSVDKDLKYAAYDGTTWQTTTVDGAGIAGVCNSLAFTPDGQPVIASLAITGFAVTGDSCALMWTSSPSRIYRISGSVSMQPDSWHPVMENIIADSDSTSRTVITPVAAMRFFRVEAHPPLLP